MEQVVPEGQKQRLFSEQQAKKLKQEFLETALAERPEIVGTHLMRIMQILGKYEDSIPNGTILQPFPIPTPIAAVGEYAKNELIGTIVAVFGKDRASLTPYNKYQL